MSWSSCFSLPKARTRGMEDQDQLTENTLSISMPPLSSCLHGYSRSKDCTTLLHQPLNTCDILRVQFAGISYFLSYPHSRCAFLPSSAWDDSRMRDRLAYCACHCNVLFTFLKDQFTSVIGQLPAEVANMVHSKMYPPAP